MKWKQYIFEITKKPTDKQTDEDRFMLLYADIIEKYTGINDPKDITDELLFHYWNVNIETAKENREVFYTPKNERLKDTQNPCRAGKKHLEVRGNVIDELCEVLGISKDQDFASQIRHARIYEEDIKNSEWYRLVIDYQWQLREIYPIEVGKDFEDNPLRYFKSFCLKIMGISCSLNQPKSYHPDELEGLFKEYKREGIFTKHYKDVFPKPRYAPTKMKTCCDDFINKKIEQGEELTRSEQTLRSLRKHVEIHRKQPQCKALMSGIQDFQIFDIDRNDEFLNHKQNRTQQAFDTEVRDER